MASSGLQFPSLDQAIAGFENANTSYNNPMAIQAGPLANSYGATGVAPNGLATFANPSQSYAAGDSILGNLFDQGDSLAQALETYSGLSAGSQTLTNYTNYVSNQTGISANEIPPVENSSYGAVTGGSVSLDTDGNGTILLSPSSAYPELLPGIPSPFNVQQAPAAMSATATLGQNPSNMIPGDPLGNLAGLSAPLQSSIANASQNSGLTSFLSSISSWLTSSTAGFSFGRIGLFLLALIVIAGAVFSFKPVRDVATSAARVGAMAAA